MMHVRQTIHTCALIGATAFLLANRLEADEGVHEHLVKIMERQAADWNEGNIEAFMNAYWKSDRLTFCSGGKVVRGWSATMARYKEKYRDKAAMGKLTFSEMESDEIGDGIVLMIGRWHLELPEPKSGNYSLVWRKLDGRWLIIHDHSSVDAK